jgi:hypothetical protein
MGACDFNEPNQVFYKEKLINAVRTAMSGRLYLSPDITGVVVSEYLRYRKTGDDKTLGNLTLRYLEHMTAGSHRQSGDS